MSTGGGTTVQSAPEWADVMAQVASAGGDDVYFQYEYTALFADPADTPEAFVFRQGAETFVLPYVRRPIQTTVLEVPVFDLESAYGYGGPLSTSDNPAFLTSAWEAFLEICAQRNVVAGFIRFHPFLDNYRLATPGAATVTCDRDIVVAALDQSPEEVWNGYSQETRNKVRKGRNRGVSVQSATGVEALVRFAGLYREHMAELRAHSSYLFDDTHFQRIDRLGPAAYRVYFARHDDAVVGGALVLLSRRFAHYHLSSCPRRFNVLAVNSMLRHGVFEDLLGSGRHWLNFGGGRSSGEDDSLLKFKSGFSQARRAFHFGAFIGHPERYRQLCDDWALSHPDLVEQFGTRVLRYRIT